MTRLMVDREISSPGEVVVGAAERHYLVSVRRHRVGDLVEILDRRGRRFVGRVARIDPTEAAIALVTPSSTGVRASPVRLVVAVPKRNLLDDVVRHVSEIGVSRLSPVLGERSVARPGADRVVRWRRIAKESIRQCGREVPMDIDDVKPLAEILAEPAGQGTRLLVHERAAGTGLVDVLRDSPAATPLVLGIGPEGGFTDTEVEEAARQGWRAVSLGPSILRVETAAVVAATLAVAATGGLGTCLTSRYERG